jgi:isopenicillin N synthase-like dioxygenase
MVLEVLISIKWLTANPALRPVLETYLAEMMALGERFLRLVGEALALPRDILLTFLSEQHRLKLVRYPPVPSRTDTSKSKA